MNSTHLMATTKGKDRMLTSHELVGEIMSAGDDEHDEDAIADYGIELVIDLGGVVGIHRFDLVRMVFNHKDEVIEFRNFSEDA